MPFLYSASTSSMAGGRMMARLAALVLGSLTISFPPTGQNCLSMRSFPVAKSRSSHRRASSSPRRIPVVRSSRNSLYIPSALAWMRNRRISSWVSTCISLPLMGGSLHPAAGLPWISFASTALSRAIWQTAWQLRTERSAMPFPRFSALFFLPRSFMVRKNCWRSAWVSRLSWMLPRPEIRWL